jgi:cell fate regulator YaaT (PSP1 superfamily)
VSEEIGGLPVLEGLAGDGDKEAAETSRKTRAAARVAGRRLIREHQLPMKIVGVDHVVASNHTTLYFTAPHRVDFRALVRDLAATLKGRVELRQLSARDEARLTGGIGSCGRELCCATFLVDFEPVSVRMAKDQDLPLNPLRISGACGRLMCCLKYEHPLYEEFAAKAPSVGTDVETPEGDGRVLAHDVPGEKVVVRMAADGRVSRCALASVCGSRKAYESRDSVISE